MNSDPTGWDCLLDRYLGSDCGTGSQVTVLPNTAEDFHLINGDASRLCLRHITPSKLNCCTFQESRFDHGWLEP